MKISCEQYYENYLGDSCDNNCENCYGKKEVYECVETFDVSSPSFIMDRIVIEKGSWYWKLYENLTHVSLTKGDGYELIIIKDLFEKYFTSNFVI